MLLFAASDRIEIVEIQNCRFMIDVATAFFSSIIVEGWFHCPEDALKAVSLTQTRSATGMFSAVGRASPGVGNLGSHLGFRLEALFSDGPPDLHAAGLQFVTSSGRVIDAPLGPMIEERTAADRPQRLHEEFWARAAAVANSRVLDLSSDASGQLECPVGDQNVLVLPLEAFHKGKVDHWQDLNCFSTILPPSSFDAAISLMQFQHVAQPWKVAAEMNKVLRIGGLVYAQSRQTFGLHHVPRDRWRFSDSAWHSLFNVATGFEVLGTAMTRPAFVIPHLSQAGQHGLEALAGYQDSVVLARKTAHIG
jgi:hypothetical protein